MVQPWAHKEGVADVTLLDAAKEIVACKVDADLRGCLFKKRLSRAGAGKRGGYRVIVGYRKYSTGRLVFLYAYVKSDKANLSDREEAALSLVVENFVSISDKKVEDLINIVSILEVQSYD